MSLERDARAASVMRTAARAPDELGALADGEVSTSPRFTVRFHEGRVELTLARPLRFAGGTLKALTLECGVAPRVTDFSRGWRAFAHRRSTALALALSIDVRALGLEAGGDGHPAWSLVSAAGGALLVERKRPWGHVAIELRPSIDGGDLLLVPVGARSASRGPSAPITEIEDVLRALAWSRAAAQHGAPRLDTPKGAIVIPDLLRDALTDALVPHGVRVPDLRALAVTAELAGELTITSSGAHDPTAARELGRAVGPLLARARAGEPEATLSREVAALPPALRLAFGAVPDERVGDPPSPLVAAHVAFARAIEEGVPATIARAAQRLDAEERAPGVATDALLLALSRAGVDPAVARDLAGRAFARSPSRPEVLATCLELQTAGADPGDAQRMLLELERRQREAGRRVDPWLDVAIARSHERAGDHDAALDRWERAARSPLTIPETFEGLSRQLVRRGRLSDALGALDRARELYRQAHREPTARRAALAAARIALAAGEPRAAEARLDDIAGAPGDVLGQIEHDVLALKIARALGQRTSVELRERALVASVEHLGLDAPEDAIVALLDAARIAGDEGDGTRADALRETVARARPGDVRIEEARRAELASAIATIEREGDRAARARAIADGYRGRGRYAEAASILARAGEIDRDATMLRVALDLAERSGDRALFSGLLERTLAVVGDGPARDALLSRRPGAR